MRIGVVSDVIYPWTKGGAELRFYEVYRRLAENHEIHYYTMRYPGMRANEFEYEGMHIHCVCRAPNDMYVKGRRRMSTAAAFAYRLLRSLQRAPQFDIIDSNGPPFLHNVALRLHKLVRTRTTFVSTWHEHWSPREWWQYVGPLFGTLGILIQQVASSVPDKIVAVSDDTAKMLRAMGRRNQLQTHVIENGVDMDVIRSVRSSTRTVPRRLVFAGRLIPEKRVDKFIDLVRWIARRIPDITATVVGGGSERVRLENLAEDAEVTFTGFLAEHEEVLREIAKGAVFISFSEREGFNMTALEACQLGVPTFVRHQYFQHENLFRICENNRQILLDSIRGKHLRIQDPDERFSWNRITQSVEDVFVRWKAQSKKN